VLGHLNLSRCSAVLRQRRFQFCSVPSRSTTMPGVVGALNPWMVSALTNRQERRAGT